MLIEELARLVGGKLSGDGSIEIQRVASIDSATENEIAFLEKDFQTSAAACLIIPENFSEQFDGPTIQVKNPKLAFAQIAEKLHPPKLQDYWHKTAFIANPAD